MHQIYVTLEPCSHKNILGKSCADLIIESGISEVFICCVDPDQEQMEKVLIF
jgi:pyrimidine deaminase RibD-like protein